MCPRRAATTVIGTPRAMRREPCVCRRSCTRRPGKPSALAFRENVRVTASASRSRQRSPPDAGAYWHFLLQPAPFLERLIGADPDFFYEACLIGWGGTELSDFDHGVLAQYQRCWRDPATIHGSCADHRAAASIDVEHKAADVGKRVGCLTLVFYGSRGLIRKCFDVAAVWRKRCANVFTEAVAGTHYFIDQYPDETARILAEFLCRARHGRTV